MVRTAPSPRSSATPDFFPDKKLTRIHEILPRTSIFPAHPGCRHRHWPAHLAPQRHQRIHSKTRHRPALKRSGFLIFTEKLACGQADGPVKTLIRRASRVEERFFTCCCSASHGHLPLNDFPGTTNSAPYHRSFGSVTRDCLCLMSWRAGQRSVFTFAPVLCGGSARPCAGTSHIPTGG